MLHAYPRGMRLLKKTLHQFSPMDTIQWFEERGVTLKEESDGRMFPVSNSSQTIIDCLLREVAKHKIHLQLKTEVVSIKKNHSFQLTLKNLIKKLLFYILNNF